tara:strand:+ start:302 stop:457 length:156 start_codon:yes stop_codon:yes gene_type:complete
MKIKQFLGACLYLSERLDFWGFRKIFIFDSFFCGVIFLIYLHYPALKLKYY